MRHLFLMARLYPYWALPMSIVLAQLFFFFRRRRNTLFQLYCGAGITLLMGGVIAWFVFRGDLHSDDWVRSVIGS